MKKHILLCLMLAISLTIIGCGSSSSNPPATAPADNGSGEEVKQNDDKEQQITMLLQYGLFDPKTEFVNQLIKEKTGYDVQYEMLPAENADEKLNLLVANKEKLDVMKLNSAQFYNLATAGALEPIDDLLAAHGSHIMNAIKPESWGSATINNQKFAVPETGAGVSIGEELVVRQDWLDELGLSIPTNTDELYNVLKTIKEEKNITPLTGSKDSLYGDIAAAFGVYTPNAAAISP